jgi:UDP-N-acetylglucosamine 2-epimerase
MQKMKIVTVLGTRPQFIKAALVSRELRLVGATEIMVNTGQHFDHNMAGAFLEDLDMVEPAYNLHINTMTHGAMTGRMLAKVEDVLYKEGPDKVLVYGDTNSTLAGALSAAKLDIPVTHVEAGIRCGNKSTPEEINRICVDHCSTTLLTPTSEAITNLWSEGITKGVHNVGDVMYDLWREVSAGIERPLETQYNLLTLHRQNNTDYETFWSIMDAMVAIAKDMPVIFPTHPRVSHLIKRMLREDGMDRYQGIKFISPVRYPKMVELVTCANVIFTDSGGLQKEAYFANVPCVTLRKETEWPNTVRSGYNTLVGNNKSDILRAYADAHPLPTLPYLLPFPFGRGDAHKKIVDHLVKS